MNINRNHESYKKPFRVVICDAMDAYYYADIMDYMTEFEKPIEDLELAIKVADALFISKNYKWKSFEEMIEKNEGWDVRIYDAEASCVYASHERFKDNWIV